MNKSSVKCNKLKSETGNTYINWMVGILVLLIFVVIVARLFLGENNIIKQKREEKIKNEIEENITVELTNYTKY